MTDFNPKSFLEDEKEDKEPSYFNPVEFLKSPQKEIPKGEGLPQDFIPQYPIISPLARKAFSAYEATFGEEPGEDWYSKYKNLEKAAKQQEAISRAKYPTGTMATEMLGASMLPYPSRTAKGFTDVLGHTSDIVKSVLAAGGYGAAESGLQTLEPGEVLPEAYKGAKESMESQALLGEALPRTISGAGKGYATFVGGIKPSALEKYRQRRPEFKDESLESLRSDVNQTLKSLEEDELEKKALAKQKQQEYSQGKKEAEELAARESGEKYSDFKLFRDRKLRDIKNLQPEESVIKDIMTSRKDLQKGISSQSSKAFDVLSSTGKTASVKNIKNHIAHELKGLMIGGKLPSSEEARYLLNEWKWLGTLKEDRISFTDLKKYLMNMDENIANAYSKLSTPGGRLTSGDKAVINLRGWIDDFYLKKIPEYEEIMRPLRDHTKLAKDLDNIIGSEKDIYSLYNRLSDPRYKKERESVEKLGDIFNKNYRKEFQSFADMKYLAKNPEAFDDYIRSSKEWEDYVKTSEAGKKNIQDVESRLASEKEAASKSYEKVKEKREPVKGISESEPLIRRNFQEKKNFKSKEDLEAISQLTRPEGQQYPLSLKESYPRRAENIGLMEMLDKPFIHGSRNVNLMGASLRGVANKLGISTDQAGAVGSMLGAVSDIVGRSAVKGFVDILDHPKYGKMLSESAKRGAQSLALTTFILNRNDPEFRKALEDANRQP